MPRPGALRRVLAVIAFLAAFMDPAMKLVHGVVHCREAAGVADQHETRAARALNGGGDASLTPADHDDGDHGVLHQVAPADLMPRAALPASRVAAVPAVGIAPARRVAFVGPSLSRPPSAAGAPAQPRAPPLG